MATRDYTYEEFIIAWQSSKSVTEVAKRLATKQATAELSALACHLRKRQVPLKTFQRGASIDYEGLAALALETKPR